MKESGYLMSFKRLNKNKNGASKSLSNGGDSQGEITTSNDDNNNSTNYKATSLRRRFKNLYSRKKKSLYKLRHHRFVDFFLFKIASLLEAIAMVATLVFFFFRYGFHF
uniref:Putative ovule protein n=1 Tax=Solanum chacoense TaxID=4108 RepID=A0A0V0GWN4_SOLCH